MAETIVQGPLVSGGSLLNNSVSPTDGPEIQYQGSILPDPRFSPMNKDGLAPGRVKGYGIAPSVTLVDNIMSVKSTSLIAAAQAPSTTVGVPLALVTAQAGTGAGVPVFAPGIPILPSGTTVVVTTNAIDFGFTTGTTAANSSTVVVVDNTLFSPGQWLVIPGVNGTTTRALFTQVQLVSSANTTVITVLPTPQTALSNVGIGQANLYNQLLPPATQFGPSAAVPTAAEPYRLAGFGLAFDPAQGVARTLAVAAVTINSGTTALTVTGYDIYGVPMTELITCSGTTIVNGKKAFKYVSSIVVNTAATTVTPASVGVGVSDIVGFNLRSDKWEYLTYGFGGTTLINNVGYTQALLTSSGLTTMDVRGTLNFSSAIASSANGTRRLTVIGTMPLVNMLNATPLSTSSLFGAPQSATTT